MLIKTTQNNLYSADEKAQEGKGASWPESHSWNIEKRGESQLHIRFHNDIKILYGRKQHKLQHVCIHAVFLDAAYCLSSPGTSQCKCP